jgi:hypothetical protein
MTRQIITPRAGLLQMLSVDWDIDWRNQAQGDFNDGLGRTQFAGFPRWVGTPRVRLGRAALGEWRATRASAQGRVGLYRIRMQDLGVFNPADAGATGTEATLGKTTAAGNYFSNGFGWEWSPFALAVADYAAGAEVIRVDTTSCNGLAPVVGQIMSHDDWPFAVTYVRDRGSDIYELGIQMPLRAAITSGDQVLLQGRGRFEARESGMGRVAYDRNPRAAVELDFVEVLAR